MNRKIKFRYYQQQEKTGRIMYRTHDLITIEHALPEPAVDWPIIARVQWTGLLDRYGVEIYEGDIVRAQRYASGNGTIAWWETDACFSFMSPLKEYHHLTSWGELEILGNIHQNPELLTPTS